MSDSPQDDQYEAFVRLLLEHEPRVHAFLRGLLPTWQDVEEVTQEASLVAWRKFRDFEEGTSFGGWLLTIARYEALKYRRRAARSPLIFSDDVWELLADPANDEDLKQARRKHLEACLEKLPPHARDLILRVHEPGVFIRDVAIQNGKSEQSFYKVIQRLRRTLLDCVAKGISAEGMG